MSYALCDTFIWAGWMTGKIGNCEKSESKLGELRHKFFEHFQYLAQRQDIH